MQSISSFIMNLKAEQRTGLCISNISAQQLFKPLPLSAAPPVLFPIIIH